MKAGGRDTDAAPQLTTSTMYSINISSMTLTVSFAGLRSSPKPYMRLRTGPLGELLLATPAKTHARLTFFGEQSTVTGSFPASSAECGRVPVIRRERVCRRHSGARGNGRRNSRCGGNRSGGSWGGGRCLCGCHRAGSSYRCLLLVLLRVVAVSMMIRPSGSVTRYSRWWCVRLIGCGRVCTRCLGVAIRAWCLWMVTCIWVCGSSSSMWRVVGHFTLSGGGQLAAVVQ